MKSKYSIVIEKEEKLYVAYCVELGIASQGKNLEEAKNNIKEAIELYIESFHDQEDLIFSEDKIFLTMDLEVPINA